MKMFSGWILLLGFAFVQANMKPIWTYEPATDVTSVVSSCWRGIMADETVKGAEQGRRNGIFQNMTMMESDEFVLSRDVCCPLLSWTYLAIFACVFL